VLRSTGPWGVQLNWLLEESRRITPSFLLTFSSNPRHLKFCTLLITQPATFFHTLGPRLVLFSGELRERSSLKFCTSVFLGAFSTFLINYLKSSILSSSSCSDFSSCFWRLSNSSEQGRLFSKEIYLVHSFIASLYTAYAFIFAVCSH
jgi:hypothetical protein